MGFMKRALLAVRRRKARTAILAVLFFIIANMVLAGFAIRNATEYAGEAARKRLGGTVTLRYDTQKAMREMFSGAAASGGSGQGTQPGRFSMETEPVTEAMIAQVAANEHVLDYNAAAGTQADSPTLIAVEVTGSDDAAADAAADAEAGGKDAPARPEGGLAGGMTMGTFTVSGVSSTALAEDFSSGSSTLLEGGHITGSDTASALIESTLAETNGLSVGDTIDLSPAGDTEQTVTVTVTGIYEAEAEADELALGRFNLTAMLPYNTIYTDIGTALAIGDMNAAVRAAAEAEAAGTEIAEPEPAGIDSVTFYLDDPANVEPVIAWAQTLDGIDWDSFTLDGNDAAYAAMMAPVENAADQADTIMLVTVVAGIAVLALILTMWARDRLYETGVLLAIGESKARVVLQYVSEVLIVAVLAFALSLASGELVAQKVGDRLLQQEITAEQTADASPSGFGGGDRIGMGGARSFPGGLGGRTGLADVDIVDEIDVRVTPGVIASLFGAGLLIVGLSAAVPSVTVMRYKPKTILSKAN